MRGGWRRAVAYGAPVMMALAGLAWLGGWMRVDAYGPFLPPAMRLDGYDSALLQQTFLRMNYDLDAVGEGGKVPRVILASLPRDLHRIEASSARKELFLATMLPLVLQTNEEIAADRRRLLDLRAGLATAGGLSWRDEVWLEQLAEDYGLAEPNPTALLARIDLIPPSLALAQAAEESGWGTSRFARDGNALFGQWSFGGDDIIQPLAGRGGYGVRTFGNLSDAVRAYARNLNSHGAYRDFRSARAAARASGRPLDGFALAGTLTGYSERGHGYVKSLRLIMRANGLSAFDAARFAG